MSEIEIENSNDGSVLKCPDVWKFIRDYCPTSVEPVETLRKWGRTLAEEMALQFDTNDHFTAVHPTDANEEQRPEQQHQESTNSVPNSSKWFGYRPSASKREAAEYFNEYMNICNRIEARGIENQHCDNVIRSTTKRTFSGSKFEMDGCLLNKSTATGKDIVSKGLATTDVLAVMEYKKDKNNDTVRDNRLKIVSAVFHIMQDDVRRRFMYAISVEDTDMTLWYFARDHCVRTTFNWWKHKATMISVLLSLMCASEEDLGMDSRIHLRPARPGHPNLKVQFIYELKSGEKTVYYRTEKSISEPHGVRITGRKTRIFEVVEVDSKSDDAVHKGRLRQVLKDTWMDADRMAESEIQDRVFKDIETFVNSSAADQHEHLGDWVQDGKIIDGLAPYLTKEGPRKEFRDLFLCIALESTGPTLRQKRGEYLRVPGRDTFYPKSIPAQQDSYDLTSRCPSDSILSNKCDCKATVPGSVISKPPRLYPAKKRTFIIFNDICTPIHTLPDVGAAFHVLADTVIALLLMSAAKWVHRDISAGNVMAIHDSTTGRWEAKLGDLEYAKKVDDKSSSTDPKTGTPYFMAAEILRNSYFNSESNQTKVRSVTQSLLQALHNKKAQPLIVEDPPVFHNFYHDVESIFWIAYWIVTCRVGHQPSLEYAAPIFSFDVGPNDSRNLALSKPINKAFKENLRADLLPLADWLEQLRQILWHNLSQQNRERTWLTISDKTYHLAAYLLLDSVSVPGMTWCKMQESKSVPFLDRHNSLPKSKVTATLLDELSGSTIRRGTKRGRSPAHEGKSAKRRSSEL